MERIKIQIIQKPDVMSVHQASDAQTLLILESRRVLLEPSLWVIQARVLHVLRVTPAQGPIFHL